ncbi:MmpS family transport accessory protein [Nocardia nepalensis]|uniref:MmpS family transport accessory protein n=1 Tax=Nocardia nepalensis TaxID=3375448 RepID=UPI003B685F8E
MTYQPPPQYPGYPGQGYPGYPGYSPQQPPKGKPVWPWVLGGIFLAIVLIVGGCVAVFGSIAYRIDKESKKEVAVTYEISGTGTADISYTSGDFESSSDNHASLPWTKAVTLTGFVRSGRVSATVSGSNGGTVSCRILRDGKVVVEESDSGSYAYVSCYHSFD